MRMTRLFRSSPEPRHAAPSGRYQPVRPAPATDAMRQRDLSSLYIPVQGDITPWLPPDPDTRIPDATDQAVAELDLIQSRIDSWNLNRFADHEQQIAA